MRSRTAADELLEQYKCILQFVKKDYEFEFKNCKERVDVFLYAHINDKKEFQPLWSIFKLLLTICHSQSMVERGLSVKNDMVTPNLRNETLVSLRTVCDAVNCMNIHLSCSKLVISVTEHLVEVVDKLSTTAVVFSRSERILKCKHLYGA